MDAGWTYFSGEFAFTNPSTILRAYREGGYDILIGFNVWAGTIKRKPYIQLFEFIEAGTVTLKYILELGTTNQYRPEFTQSVYSVNVTEGSSAPLSLLQVLASDSDGDEVSYAIDDSLASKFSLMDDGTVSLLTEVDYEKETEYTVIVEAVDDAVLSKTGQKVFLYKSSNICLIYSYDLYMLYK